MHFTRVKLLACVPASIYAFTSLRVEELTKLVQSQASDENAVRALSEVYLTERLSDDTLPPNAGEAPGPKTQSCRAGVGCRQRVFGSSAG